MELYEDNSWQRLEMVITWSKMNTNRFAQHIGLSRAETLYQIERGTRKGISRKLAETIVKRFPEISISWLLTGAGEMFHSMLNIEAKIDYYNLDAELNISNIESLSPNSKIILPNSVDADLAMIYRGDAMGMVTPTNTTIVLKRVSSEQIIFGKEYLVATENFTLLRRVRSAPSDDMIRLTAVDREMYDDMDVRREAIESLYRVVAKLIVNY